MVTGRQKQLIKQVGEYLVAAELCRRELITTSFTGNVPIFDLLAITSDDKMKTIQVKATMTAGGWNLDASNFLDFELSSDKKQHIRGIRNLATNNTIFCFVQLGSFGNENNLSRDDEFYLVPILDLQKIVKNQYLFNLKKVDYYRQKNPESHHMKIKKDQIHAFKNNWDCILK